MKKIFSLLFFIFILLLRSFPQTNGIVTGVAFDTAINQPVQNATITIMKRKDSSLVTFTMADNNGKFYITRIADGDYLLLITHINYYNATAFFVINKEHTNVDLGNITINDKSRVLKEVLVTTAPSPVTLVGDTIQYNAGSFKIRPNATVEDLLKKLPGVKIDKDGTIKAQGEKVQRVLVDGKEFFGNDPKIATKNLPADAIDKVQVFDKLSDQAQMTGFDDGNSEKTINLSLKKDKKKGAFGKINTGMGNDERYQGKFNVNSFKGAKQMSAIGMANNTNAEGFSFFDILNFTGALSQLRNGGNMNITISQDDPLAGLLGGNNTGINTTWGGGINYNNLIGTKTDFQANYFYSRFNPKRHSNIQRQYFSPANLYQQNSYADNLNNSQRLNFSVDHQVDSFNSIKISSNISYQQTTNKTTSVYSTMSPGKIAINEGNSDNVINSKGITISANVLYRKRFRKKGRSFSLNFLTNLSGSDGNGSLRSFTDFYDTRGLLFQKDSIGQVNDNAANLHGVNAKAVYTEPVFKRSLLEFSVGKSFTVNTADKSTYDYNDNNGKFDIINKPLTNNFENTYGYTTAGIRLRKQTKKYNYAAGVTWQQAALKGKVISGLKDSSMRKNFTNLLPNVRVQYKFSQFKNIMLNYITSTTQPTVAQLQPIADNSNPLYIKQGNPDLKQEFTHTLRLNTSFVDPFKNKNLFVFLTLQQTRNKIVNNDKINGLGVDSVMPVNVNGVFNMNGNISLGFPVRFLKGTLDLSTDIMHYYGKQFVNGETNIINTTAVGPEIRLEINPSDRLNLSFNTSITHSQTKYSLTSAGSAKYLIYEYGSAASWELPNRFLLATDFNYRINKQYKAGFNTRVPLWSASISKQMLRFNRGEIKLSANDLLNRNIGINRSASQNYIEDTRVNSLRRFFLLSLTYNLTKTVLNYGEKDGGIKIMR